MVHIIDNRLCCTIKQYDTHFKMIHLIDNKLCNNIKQYIITHFEMVHLIVVINRLFILSNSMSLISK